MTNPDGTLTKEEADPLVKKLLIWFKSKNLKYIEVTSLIKYTRERLSWEYKKYKKYLEEQQHDRR